MRQFILKRLGQGVIVLVGITVLTFVLLQLLPGGPAEALLGARATPERIEDLNRSLGLSGSPVSQYFHWLTGLLRGDLGQSYQRSLPVSELLQLHLPRTLILVGSATLLSVVIAIPLALYQAFRRKTIGDYVTTLFVLFGYSMPIFWFGLILIMVFAIDLQWLPPGGVTDPGESETDLSSLIRHLVLPSSMLAITFVAAWSRYIRSSILDALVQDFIRTARAKGVSRRRLMLRHALPNGILPLITLVGASFPLMLSGSLVTEVVFNYPGMGLLFWNAAQARDFPILMGTVVVLGVGTVLGNLAADFAHAVADPRIRRATVTQE